MTLKMTRREVLLVINSKDAQTTDNGSSAIINFQPALEMGGNAKVELIGANIWYAMPNIAAPNNTLSYEYTKEQMVKLWGHEIQRVFSDRLAEIPGVVED